MNIEKRPHRENQKSKQKEGEARYIIDIRPIVGIILHPMEVTN